MPDTTSFKLGQKDGLTHLPEHPDSKFPVGFVDIFSSPRTANIGGLLFRLYYPTSNNSPDISRWGRWFPHLEYAKGYLRYAKFGLSTPILGRLFVWLTGDPRIPAEEGGDFLTPNKPRPLVVFSHGLAGCRTTYSSLCTSLASRGLLVAVLEHGDGSASLRMTMEDKTSETDWRQIDLLEPGTPELEMRNKQVKYRGTEVSQVMDIIEEMNQGSFDNIWLYNITAGEEESFKKKIVNSVDINNVVVGGHSFGGATTVLSLANDIRFKGGIALDCWMFPLQKEILEFKGKQPGKDLLFVNCEKFQSNKNLETMRTYEGSPDLDELPSNVVTLADATHYAATDIPILMEGSSAGTLFSWLKGGSNDQHEGLSSNEYLLLNCDLFHAWVETCLHNETSSFIHQLNKNSSNLKFGINLK